MAERCEWELPEHVEAYLQRADRIPHRPEGERVLLEEIPRDASRVLDLGSGDGRLLALVLSACPNAQGVAVDFSPPMLELLRGRFANEPRVQVIEHDLRQPLPAWEPFPVVISGFAIHHLPHERKRKLYEEIWRLLEPRGVFANLEHVSSPTPILHERFLAAMGCAPRDEDPSNRLLDIETQLGWLREIGFDDVDCYWKWRELALLIGKRPSK